MWRQANSRTLSQRARGLTLKQALRSFLVVVFCVCLFCQVKQSNDKKGESAENDLLKIISVENWRFGRKDIPRYAQRTDSTIEMVYEQEERSTRNAVEEQPMTIRSGRKFLPSIVELGKKQETNAEEEEDSEPEETYHEKGAGTGDDDIDGEYQPESEEEVKQGVESADEDEQDEKDEEKDLMNYQDNERGSQLSQEEKYIRHNVAGSVLRDAPTTGFEMDGSDVKSSEEENTNEDTENLPIETVAFSTGIELSVRAVGNSADDVSGVSMGKSKTMPAKNYSSNATSVKKKELKTGAKNSVGKSHVNLKTIGSDNLVELQSNSKTAIELPLDDVLAYQDSAQDQIATLDKQASKANNTNVKNVVTAQTEKTNTTAGIKEIEGSNTASSDHIVTEGRKGCPQGSINFVGKQCSPSSGI